MDMDQVDVAATAVSSEGGSGPVVGAAPSASGDHVSLLRIEELTKILNSLIRTRVEYGKHGDSLRHFRSKKQVVEFIAMLVLCGEQDIKLIRKCTERVAKMKIEEFEAEVLSSIILKTFLADVKSKPAGGITGTGPRLKAKKALVDPFVRETRKLLIDSDITEDKVASVISSVAGWTGATTAVLPVPLAFPRAKASGMDQLHINDVQTAFILTHHAWKGGLHSIVVSDTDEKQTKLAKRFFSLVVRPDNATTDAISLLHTAGAEIQLIGTVSSVDFAAMMEIITEIVQSLNDGSTHAAYKPHSLQLPYGCVFFGAPGGTPTHVAIVSAKDTGRLQSAHTICNALAFMDRVVSLVQPDAAVDFSARMRSGLWGCTSSSEPVVGRVFNAVYAPKLDGKYQEFSQVLARLMTQDSACIPPSGIAGESSDEESLPPRPASSSVDSDGDITVYPLSPGGGVHGSPLRTTERSLSVPKRPAKDTKGATGNVSAKKRAITFANVDDHYTASDIQAATATTAAVQPPVQAPALGVLDNSVVCTDNEEEGKKSPFLLGLMPDSPVKQAVSTAKVRVPAVAPSSGAPLQKPTAGDSSSEECAYIPLSQTQRPVDVNPAPAPAPIAPLCALAPAPAPAPVALAAPAVSHIATLRPIGKVRTLTEAYSLKDIQEALGIESQVGPVPPATSSHTDAPAEPSQKRPAETPLGPVKRSARVSNRRA